MRRDSELAEDGFVLITVAGILLLIAIVAASAMIAARSQIKSRAAMQERAEATQLADGLARLVSLRLAAQRSTRPPKPLGNIRLDGTPTLCRDGVAVAEIRINDTAGLVDLNFATPSVLEALITGLGVAQPEAARLAAAIVDFRDSDDIPQVGGAENEEYRAAGRAFGPKNSNFETVDELDQVLGMTPELLARLIPFVTVHAQASGIDPTVAPEGLLRALAQDPVSTREQISLPAQLPIRPPIERASRNRLPIMTVRVIVAIPTRTKFLREAVVELTSAASTGFSVRHWTSREAPQGPLPEPVAIALLCEDLGYGEN